MIYEILGPAAVPTIICLVVGLLLLILEMFTPGVGVPGGAGLLCLLAVVIMQLGWGSPKIGILIVAIVLVILVLTLLLFIRSFQRGRLSRSPLVLQDAISGSSGEPPATESALLGSIGVSITPLRPSGTIAVSGKRLNVTTDGAFIAAGKQVKIVGQNGLDLIVEEVSPGAEA